MEAQETVQKPQRTETTKSTLPQPGRPIPSRAYPGALIVVEGTDGSGKSTQLYLLKRWLEIGGYRLYFTEWDFSPLVKTATRGGKHRRCVGPGAFFYFLPRGRFVTFLPVQSHLAAKEYCRSSGRST